MREVGAVNVNACMLTLFVLCVAQIQHTIAHFQNCSNVSPIEPASTPFVMPRDLGLHPNYLYETIWYLGILETADKSRIFGVEYMIVSVKENMTMCQDQFDTSTPSLSWLAISDVKTGVFRQMNLIANVTSNNWKDPSSPFLLQTGEWMIRQSNSTECSMRAGTDFLGQTKASRDSDTWTLQRWQGLGVDETRLDLFGLDVCLSIAANSTQAMGKHGYVVCFHIILDIIVIISKVFDFLNQIDVDLTYVHDVFV
jgi:predicted secreted hydrolase